MSSKRFMAKPTVLFLMTAVVTLLAVFYPFLPGRYDASAVALSMAMQAAAWVGLILLTPVGLLWLIHEFRRRGAVNRGVAAPDRGRRFALASCVASMPVALAATAFAVEQSGFVVALCLLGLWLAAAARGLRSVRRDHYAARSIRHVPLYLILLPGLIVGARAVFVEPVAAWSRDRAIAASESYIADIEAYRRTHGRYPLSLASLNVDYPVGTVGIDRFRYEPAGEAYNVWFQHPSSRLDVHEIVMFNPLDEQQATSHEADILQFTPERLNQTRGYFAAHDAGVPHWKVFLFD